jgi:hypothetical protein
VVDLASHLPEQRDVPGDKESRPSTPFLVSGFEKCDQTGRAADDPPQRLAYPPSVSKQAVVRLCFGATLVIAAFSLGLQFVQDWLGVWDDPDVPGQSHAVRVWRFFSYFTTQANLLVVATSLGLARSPGRDGPGWRVARLNALAGITITGLVHWFLLHPLDDFRGLLWASDTLVHIVVPILVVLGWLVFGPRRRITARVVVLGMIWPVAWLLYTLLVGRITGWYPYFFLDLGQSGSGVVALYCTAILILLFVVSCVFWMGDRWLPGRQPLRVPADGEPIDPRGLRPARRDR